MTRLPLALRLLAVLLVQAAALGWMVWDRAQILAHGAEIRLATAPVDPRDLFRGHYVRLAYDISRIRLPLVSGDDAFEENDRVFVVLERGADDAWRAVSVHRGPPDPAPPRIALAGRIDRAYDNLPRAVLRTGEDDDAAAREPACPEPCPGISVRYGIENYFVAGDRARELEKLQRTGAVEILIAVAPGGDSAIKGLIVDGALAYEEPLF